MMITLVMVPLSLSYLDAVQYGLWLVLSSTFGWLGVFDLGFGNGLRNKLSESLSMQNFELSQQYVSTGFFFLSLLSSALIVIFFFISQFVNWASLLNAPQDLYQEFNHAIILCFIFLSTNFALNIINIVLIADQKIGLSRLFGLFSSLAVLLCLYFLKTFATSSFLLFCLSMTVPGILIMIVINVSLFSKTYKYICPLFSKIRLGLGKTLIGLGTQFFVIQLTLIIVFATDNIVITKLFSPEFVTPYNIAFNYMCIPWTAFQILLQPAWSAYTQADRMNEHGWIIKTVFRLFKIWCLLLIGLIMMFFASQPIYRFWIGTTISIPAKLTVVMALFAAIGSFNGIFVTYLLGIGKINLITRIFMLHCLMNIPLSVFYVKVCGMGTEGVMLGTISCMLFITATAPAQAYFTLRGKRRSEVINEN
jgi:O-antigen/teichoic acid export membrane protein